jgi:hypothetical protein
MWLRYRGVGKNYFLSAVSYIQIVVVLSKENQFFPYKTTVNEDGLCAVLSNANIFMGILHAVYGVKPWVLSIINFYISSRN